MSADKLKINHSPPLRAAHLCVDASGDLPAGEVLLALAENDPAAV